MCEFYNLSEVEIGYVSPGKRDGSKYYKLKSGDIISLDFKTMIELIEVSCKSEMGIKFIETNWAYKKPLFAKLRLPKWKIFGFDTYKFMVR